MENARNRVGGYNPPTTQPPNNAPPLSSPLLYSREGQGEILFPRPKTRRTEPPRPTRYVIAQSWRLFTNATRASAIISRNLQLQCPTRRYALNAYLALQFF